MAFSAHGQMLEYPLCGRVWLRSPETITLGDLERRLVCGDPTSPAWKDIPLNQAMHHLKTFLQDRGYHPGEPVRERDRLVVPTGEPVRVTALRVEGAPPGVSIEKWRGIEGEILTPKLLDGVKGRLVEGLKEVGFPCPEVEMSAGVPSGTVIARVNPGTPHRFGSLSREPVEGIALETLSRFDAFDPDERFNVHWLTLTTRRILDARLVQSAYFLTRCEEGDFRIAQRFVPGPPRQVALGFGVDTERLAIVRASWRHSRLGPAASTFEAVLSGSLREQRLRVESRLYWLAPPPSRFHLRPRATVVRNDERYYETLSGRADLLVGTTWDEGGLVGDAGAGPSLNYLYTVRGPGPKDSQFLTFSLEGRLHDRYYELYRLSPRRGLELRLDGNFADRRLLAPFSATSVRLGGAWYRNLGGWDPPVFVLGLRGAVAATFTSHPASDLTAGFRHYLGGSSDLRGWSRQELPGPDGALTAAFAGVEGRITDRLPWGLQPLAFLDAGVLGSDSLAWAGPVYLSSGLGLRWETKVGVLRATFAHGALVGSGTGAPEPHFQFFFSFGEEF